MPYRWLAVAVSVLHLGYLTYLVVGGYLAWRIPRTFPLHVTAVGWGVAVVALRLPCPLTSLQNALLVRGGEPELDGGFIDHYLDGVVYPAGYDTVVKAVAATAVAVSWILLALRVHRGASRVTGRPATKR